MIAILRYAFLKNLRDGSLAAFVLGPIIMLAAPLLGMVAFNKGGLADALSMDPRSSAARSAMVLAPVAMFIAAGFAALAGFWGFRSEVASRSMGSFVLAARPATIQTALTLFGAAAAFVAYLGMSASLFALTNALPPDPWRLAFDAAIMCLCGASIGALVVTVSSEPWAMVPVYVCGILLVPWLIKTRGAVPELIALGLSIIFVTASTFLLERRCAT